MYNTSNFHHHHFLLKKVTLEKEFQKFIDVFNKLHINIPLIDDLEFMSSYTKFIKEILSNKRKWDTNDLLDLKESEN